MDAGDAVDADAEAALEMIETLEGRPPDAQIDRASLEETLDAAWARFMASLRRETAAAELHRQVRELTGVAGRERNGADRRVRLSRLDDEAASYRRRSKD